MDGITTTKPSENIRLLKNPSGEANLQVRGEAGKWVTFYSHRDVRAEIDSFGGKLCIPENHIPVLLGLGLGYHLREVLKRTNQPVLVVERDEQIFQTALEEGNLSDLQNHPQVDFIVESQVDPAIQEISRRQLKYGLKDIFLIKHPPSVRCFPGFYTSLAERLENTQKMKMGDRLKYGKFKSEKLKILLINSQYLMMGELVHAIQSLGHSLKTIVMEREAEVAQNEFIADLLKILMEFKPDFILTVNHLGFDREGIVTDFLTTLKVPFASWYVDSPMLIIKHYERNLSPYCAIFLWDQDYVADMQALGFDKVHYLPLGTNPQVFKRLLLGDNPLASQQNEISFVGNSMVKRIQKKMERLDLTAESKARIESIGRTYAESNYRNVSDVLNQDPYREDPLVKGMVNGRRVDFETLIMYKATLLHRLAHVQKLQSFRPVIRGDDGWYSLLNDSFQIGPELLYYYDLNFFYNVSKINFNITSTQMRNAVNQRVFDVPAAGKFLLTDYKSQLETLMHVGKEVVCYRDKEEVPELTRFYLAHDSLREKIAQRGRKRVLADHTYTRRVAELCSWMRKYFKD